MTFSLAMLLETIAADRKVAKPDAWVEKLKLHSEITEEAQAFTLTHDSDIADSLEEQQLEPWE